MTDADLIHSLFADPIWADASTDEDFPAVRPLLAHYTAMPTFEAIMKNDELWLANPLFMNDMEELRFGLLEAARAFRQHAGIKMACGGNGTRFNALNDAFEQKLDLLSNEDAFDTYVMCFCQHAPHNHDGILSMWRGYGGNGSGAAIVFDTSRLVPIEGSPLILAKVHYATRAERLGWIDDKLNLFASILIQNEIPVSMFYIPIHTLLERFKQFALFTKHDGFIEEQEWRMVYIKDRDRDRKFADMFHYHIRDGQIEPKLKFKPGPIQGEMDGPLRLHDLVDRIILGPSASSPIAVASVRRMLKILGKEELCAKVSASSTPYRAKT